MLDAAGSRNQRHSLRLGLNRPNKIVPESVWLRRLFAHQSSREPLSALQATWARRARMKAEGGRMKACWTKVLLFLHPSSFILALKNDYWREVGIRATIKLVSRASATALLDLLSVKG